MGYSFQLAVRVLLYASSHRQDNTYHGLCYTSCGALAGTRNSSMGPLWRIDSTTYRTISKRSYHRATSRSPFHGTLLISSKGSFISAISMSPSWGIDPMTHCTMSKHSTYHRCIHTCMQSCTHMHINTHAINLLKSWNSVLNVSRYQRIDTSNKYNA